ncbi:MFS transporter [Mastigocoleus testarum]|uniref:Sugar transporter n=1 Tax=Mastigocoleus testarum BC008 TaxID=371196 RepID=A0A0V7ZM31_9CYAN|nr:MFS transporter [Mastigocoleus testarum]KST65426.1 sugar transporter [Mastigocoleus testarum BC008]
MKDSLPEKLELNLKTKLAYGVGELGGAIPNNILVFYVLFFLTNVAGLNSSLAGGVLLVAKAWDAVNDPLIGWLSDRTRSRLGRRYPWMLVGAIPLGLFFFLQWVVPPISNQWLLFSYYTVVAILFYASISSVLVPFSSLAAEITRSYDERTSLVTVKSTFWIGGSIFVLALAQVIFARVEAPASYLILGACCGFLATLSVYLSVFGTYERYKIMQGQRRQVEEPEKIPVLKQIKIALSNKPFLYVIGIYLCSWLGVQVTAAILPYFVIDWMGLSKSHFSQMALTVQVSSLLAMFFWGAIAQRVGKKAIYCMGIPLTICAQAGLFFIQPGQVSLMYVLAVLAGVGLSTAYIVPWSMLPDVVDLDELNTGQRREGIFYGFVVQFQKLGLAAALFLVGRILDWAGLIPAVASEAPPNQPNSVLWAIRLIIGPIPTLILIVGLVLAYFYPITRSKHEEILLKLKERRDGQG